MPDEKTHITFICETKGFTKEDAKSAIAELGWTDQVSFSFIFDAKNISKRHA